MDENYINKPLISIVTVVYNGEKYLEETIQSVLNQTYDNIEYIIIDGGSTDGTVDIIKKYEDEIDYWVSEKDAGIYDAMNKGLKVLQGEWVFFLNSGDYFYSNDVLQKIFSQNLKGYDAVYGDLMTQNGLKKGPKIHGIKSLLTKTIGHQSIFIKRHIHQNFNTNYRISADYDLLISLIVKHCNFLYVDETIAFYDVEKEYMTSVEKNNYALKRVVEKFNIAVLQIPFPYKVLSAGYYFLQLVKYKVKSIKMKFSERF